MNRFIRNWHELVILKSAKLFLNFNKIKVKYDEIFCTLSKNSELFCDIAY